MLVHNLLALLLLYAILVIGEEIIVSNTTERPESLRTGKLNQFKGYYTPKPIPQNIQRCMFKNFEVHFYFTFLLIFTILNAL